MNCLHPDIHSLRCWICPHNPFTRSMPPYVVCASLSPEKMNRLRADCRADDLVVHEFELVFDLPARVGPVTRERFRAMGFQVSDMPEDSPIPGNTRFSFFRNNTISRSNTDDEDAGDDEDDEGDEEDDDDGFYEDHDDASDGGDESEDSDDEDSPGDEHNDEEEDAGGDSVAHLNDTLMRSLFGEITDLQSRLDDLLQTIFDLYPLFPDRKDVLSDMEDDVIAMMDDVDDLLTMAKTYDSRYACEED